MSLSLYLFILVHRIHWILGWVYNTFLMILTMVLFLIHIIHIVSLIYHVFRIEIVSLLSQLLMSIGIIILKRIIVTWVHFLWALSIVPLILGKSIVVYPIFLFFLSYNLGIYDFLFIFFLFLFGIQIFRTIMILIAAQIIFKRALLRKNKFL